MNNFDWGWMNFDHGLIHKTHIEKETFEDRIYERFFEVEEGDIVLDIGASIGPFTYSILTKNPKHVFCIEPSETEFKTLVKNTIGYPVTHILKGISDSDSVFESDQVYGTIKSLEGISFRKLIEVYGLEKIDFLKTDCEGGEYSIFTENNLALILERVKKISGEWHLGTPELKSRFRNFRDTFLRQFNNFEVYSIDGVDIKWNLWNDHFIDYYSEIIIYIDNRKPNTINF
jgi:FkbM family methyltransferase